MCGSSPSTPGCTAPGDAVPCPGFSGAVDPDPDAVPADVFVGCSHRQAATGGAGHGWPGHPTSNPD
jgi:hypothetical protein